MRIIRRRIIIIIIIIIIVRKDTSSTYAFQQCERKDCNKAEASF